MKNHIYTGGIFAAGVAVGFAICIAIAPKNSAHVDMPAEPVVSERAPDSIPAAATVEKFLNAPEFKIAGTLYSDVNGQVYLRYTESTGAEQYEVAVADPEGKPVKTFTTKRTVFMVKGLAVDPKAKSTPYKVQVIPIGANSERGRPSEWRDVAMLPMRNLAPPTIKSITTEE